MAAQEPKWYTVVIPGEDSVRLIGPFRSVDAAWDKADRINANKPATPPGEWEVDYAYVIPMDDPKTVADDKPWR